MGIFNPRLPHVPINIYVDGESHFIRSRQMWKSLAGEKAELDQIVYQPDEIQMTQQPKIAVDHRAHLFWDEKCVPSVLRRFFTGLEMRVHRSVYFTAFSGPLNELHAVRTNIRSLGFEPQVVLEQKSLAKQRESAVKTTAVIEKAKGVDISLTVRLLEDAYRDVYQNCILLTSDIDYLPVIEAVRRMGKQVYVLGYLSGLANDSPFEYVPDQFIDLGKMMKKWYVLKSQEIDIVNPK